jgi:hypothetical protein
MEPTVGQVGRALRRSFCRETSCKPTGWTAENPAFGQCLVAALVMQDYFGGIIVCADLTDHYRDGASAFSSHYWNRINGRDRDVTKQQFPPWFPYREMLRNEEDIHVVSRELEIGPLTHEAYQMLAERVRKHLQEQSDRRR